MQAQRGTHCPLLNQECIKDRCAWWVKLVGKHPQTGVPLDEWDCAVFWLPILLVENAQEMRGHQAAVESFRNVVNRQQPFFDAMTRFVEQRAEDRPPQQHEAGCQHEWTVRYMGDHGEAIPACVHCGVVQGLPRARLSPGVPG